MNEKPDGHGISHLKRREIQAPIATAIIMGLIEELGSERALQILSKRIAKDAREAGQALAAKLHGNSMTDLARVVREVWCEDEAMKIDVLIESDDEFQFNVVKCRYAEMYQQNGMEKFGKCLSCDRDFSFNAGFNPAISLERSQTIMEGADYCDFRYYRK